MFWSILSLGLLCIIAGLNLFAWRRACRAETRYPPIGQFVTAAGLRLHYVRRGDKLQPSLVLLHGSEGFLQDFLEVIDTLSLRYDVIAFDRPGHGYSESPHPADCAPDRQAEIIHQALQQLGVQEALLAGHSWSGALLISYAIKYPDEVTGLTLLAAWIHAPEPRPFWLLHIPLIPLLGPLAVSTLLILVKDYYLRKSLAEAFAPDTVPADYARMASALWQRWPRQAQTFARENTADRPVMRAYSSQYSQLRMPIIILAGEQDTVVPPNEHALRLHAALPHSELRLLSLTGHELPQTRPQAVIEAIDRCAALAAVTHPVPNEIKIKIKIETKPQINMRARSLVMRYGWNAMSYQLLNPDMEHWFSAEGGGDAVIGFTRRHRVRIAAGAPVCAQDRLADVVTEFEQAAKEQNEIVCYFGAAARLTETLRHLPCHDGVVIGAQPVWHPARWSAIISKNSSLRAQINRARNKGIVMTEWSAESALHNPDLQRCLNEWLARHPLPPLHFLTEAVTLDRLMDRRLFVAELRTEGEKEKKEKDEKAKGDKGQEKAERKKEKLRPVGFMIATPVPDRNGWLIEQIVRGDEAPNGMAELLMDGMMCIFAAEGSSYVTLGLAPLSKRADTTGDPPRPWLRLALGFVRAHGNRFYNFEGLDAFKAKFRPDSWEPIYAISNETHFSPRTLYAIAAAFSDGPPPLVLSRALLAAVKQEMVWFKARQPPKSE